MTPEGMPCVATGGDYVLVGRFWTMPAYVAPDRDSDGDVDLEDFIAFSRCFNGPNRTPAEAGCAATDFDVDSDVDLEDFLVFTHCFNGPNKPPACP